MVKGALGVLATPNAPKSAGHGAAPGHHAGAKDDAAAAPAGAIPVLLGDMWIKPGAPTAKAGKISFTASNEGTTAHGLAVVEAPAKVDGGMVDESTLLGKGAELGGGESEVVSFDLAPGGYELICYLPGHYAAGQKTAFTVQ